MFGGQHRTPHRDTVLFFEGRKINFVRGYREPFSCEYIHFAAVLPPGLVNSQGREFFFSSSAHRGSMTLGFRISAVG
jgi:hypothetical protein